MAANYDTFFQRLANLECSAGHLHIAHNPKAYVDRTCGHKDNRKGSSCKRRLQKR